MERYKEEFIEFMVDCQVLRFGDFVTKSGRNTPFFINTGFYHTGSQLKKLGHYYARAVMDNFGPDFDILFGPAYKGIPLSVAASMALSEEYGVEVGYCSNRKEFKDHGDSGMLLGTPVENGSRVLIIEDVTTAGTSVAETVPLLQSAADIQLAGLVVSVDRMERGRGEDSALDEISRTYQIPTASIVTMQDVVEYLYGRPYHGSVIIDDERKAAIDAYYARYGARTSV